MTRSRRPNHDVAVADGLPDRRRRGTVADEGVGIAMKHGARGGGGAARLTAAALAVIVALDCSDVAANEAPAESAAAVDPSRIEPSRVEVEVILESDDPDTKRRIGDAMRATIEARMVEYDRQWGPRAPGDVLLRVVVDETATDQGFVGLLMVRRLRTRGFDQIRCSPCGGTEFVAELRVALDRTAAAVARMPDTPVPPPEPSPSAEGAADRPAPLPPVGPWIRWTGYMGFGGMFSTALGGATLLVGAGFLGASAARPEPRWAAGGVGLALAIGGGTIFAVGLPMFAVDMHRYRKARRAARASAASLAWAPWSAGRSGGLSLRGRF